MIKSNKLKQFIMTNFRLPILLFCMGSIYIGYRKLYDLSVISAVKSSVNYAMLFIVITGFFFALNTVFTGLDVLDLLLGQKGKDALMQTAKKR